MINSQVWQRSDSTEREPTAALKALYGQLCGRKLEKSRLKHSRPSRHV